MSKTKKYTFIKNKTIYIYIYTSRSPPRMWVAYTPSLSHLMVIEVKLLRIILKKSPSS